MALAGELATEIISVDSAAVFKGLDIGAAKPSAEARAKVPHHLIDLCDPGSVYSVADFIREATELVQKVVQRGRIPLFVGGTMLYFKALLEGLSDMPATDPLTRRQIEAEARSEGWPAMHHKLMAIDPEYAVTLHPNHSQRIGRGLEVYRLSGKTMSALRKSKSPGLLNQFDWVQIALIPQQRAWLHRRIEQRFEHMLAQGLVDEVRALHRRGDLHSGLPALRAAGYRQVWAYLNGELSYPEMKQRGIEATRQLAKRQLTWLRSWPQVKALSPHDAEGKALDSSQIVNDALNFLPKRTI